MSAVKTVPANPPDKWSITGDFTAIADVCPGTDSPVPGLALHPETTAKWTGIYASQLWINYVAITHGDAELTVAVFDLQWVVQTNLSRLTSSPVSHDACVLRALVSARLNPLLNLTLTVRGFFPDGAIDKYAFVFSGIQYSALAPDTDPGQPGSTSHVVDTSATSMPSDVHPGGTSDRAPSETAASHSGNRTASITGGVLGGVVALGAILMVVYWLMRRRRRAAAAQRFAEYPSNDGTYYTSLTGVSPATSPSARDSTFGAGPAEDRGERGDVLFDASIAMQSMALYDAMRTNENGRDGSTSPLLADYNEKQTMSSKHSGQGASGSGAGDSSGRPVSSTATVIGHGTLNAAWQEPPPEYSTVVERIAR